LALNHRFVTLQLKSEILVSHPKGEAQLEVKIYTKPGCPYCAKAKDYYNGRKIPFQEFNAQDNLDYRKEMLAISKGDPTVPVIVEDGRLKQIGWEGRG